MASRYWVGGDGTWDASTTTHWASTSGGAGGASVPTSADDVVFDSNSGGTVTTSGTRPAKSLTFSSYAGALSASSGNKISLSGNLTIDSGSHPNISVTFAANGAVSASGAQTGVSIYSATAGVTITLAANFNGARLDHTAGTFDAAGYDVHLVSYGTSGSTARTLKMGGGTWTINTFGGGGGGFWSIGSTTGLTFIPGTSLLEMTGTSASSYLSFAGGGLSYYAAEFAGYISILGNNTFSNLTFDAGLSAKFAAGSVQTAAAIAAVGSAGSKITLKSAVAGSTWSLSQPSGTVSADWLVLQDSIATGGATFDADDTVDLGNNTGWNITPPPGGSGGMFLAF